MKHAVMASEAAGWCGSSLYGPDTQICRVWKSDSRDIAPGDAFVALKGANVDGHMFVRQAIDRGARLLLVNLSEMERLSHECPGFSGVSVVAVPDTSSALVRIAQMYLEVQDPKVIGITGSVGKTTTRELVVSVLKRRYKVHSAIRSFNTVIGCSLTILAMSEDTDILVLELGTNHFGEISEMVSLFPPDFVIITEVAPAHLEGFGNLEGVLRAKLEICSSAKLTGIIYNADNFILNEYMSYNFNNILKITVGKRKNADIRIIGVNVSLGSSGGRTVADFSSKDGFFTAEAPLFGMHHAYNMGYAYAAGKYFGISEEDIRASLAGSKPIAGRGICKKLKNNSWVIDESYNANPSSMGAAIDNALGIAGAQKYKMYAVLGGMKELGEDSAFWHQKMLDKLIGFEKVFLLGDEWYAGSLLLPANTERSRTFEEIMEKVAACRISDGVILIKGSNSYGLKRLVALLTEGPDVY